MDKKTLIIAEKPSAADAISKSLGGFKKHSGYLESPTYLLTWAVGHLLEWCEPEDYDKRYKSWRIADLPIVPDFRLKPNSKTREQLQVIEMLAKRAHTLINACDCAREGELIFGHIREYLGLNKLKTLRLWTASLTEEAIRQAFQQMRPASDYESLYQSARNRSEGDWLVGINATRAFTSQFGDLYSVGRVQTPVLSLLYRNWKQRDQFVSETFYEVIAAFQTETGESYSGKWTDGESTRLQSIQKGLTICAEVQGAASIIERMTKTEHKEFPPKLFDLTTLQRTSNALFGFSAQKTLSVAQSLYEKHKMITYPRTSSQFISENELPDVHRVIQGLTKHPVYAEFALGGNQSFVNRQNRQLVRPSAIEDHHAILPTGKHSASLSADEQKVFDLIVRRILAHLYPASVFQKTELMTRSAGHLFRTVEERLVTAGWRIVMKEKNSDGKRPALPHVEKGTKGTCTSAETAEGHTEPPKPYTEGSLLSAMETCGKELEDEELRQAMKDSGLGTPATRAAILERLKQVGYLESKGKTLEITEKGKQLIQLVEQVDIPILLSPEMTGAWEKFLGQIAKGESDPKVFRQRIELLTASLVERVAAMPKQKRKREQTVIGSCPICGGDVVQTYRGFSCIHFKEPAKNGETQGCRLRIWKTVRGKTISDKQAGVLLKKGRTAALSFRTKEGKRYSACIVLNHATGELSVELAGRAKHSNPNKKSFI